MCHLTAGNLLNLKKEKKNPPTEEKKGCMIEIRLKHKGWEWAQILSKVLLDF